MSDPTIANRLQNDFTAYVYDKKKPKTPDTNTTTAPEVVIPKEASSDDKITTKPLTSLRSSDANPVEIKFTDMGNNIVAAHTDDITSGTSAIIDTAETSADVAVKKGGKGYDYNSPQADNFKKTFGTSIKPDMEIAEGAEGSKVTVSDFLKDGVPADIQPDPKAKLKESGNKEIQRLQAYLGLPPDRQDGVFGSETMANLKKQYTEAMKSGTDKKKIETLGCLLEGLDKVANTDPNAPKDPSLSSLSKTHASIGLAKNAISKASECDFTEATKIANQISNTKIKDKTLAKLSEMAAVSGSDFTKAIEIANQIKDPQAKEKTLARLSDMASENLVSTIGSKLPGPIKADSLIKLISENCSPANKSIAKAFEALYEKKGDGETANWSLKPDLTKLNAMTDDEIKLLPPSVQKVIVEAKTGAKLEKRQADEAPHVQTLSDDITNPKKELSGRDHIDTLKDADSTPRGKAVSSAFNALYSTVGGTGGGKDEKWKYNPDSTKLKALASDPIAMKQLSQAEKIGLLKAVNTLRHNDESRDMKDKILASMHESPMDESQKATFKAELSKLNDNQKSSMISQMLLGGKNDDFASSLLKDASKSIQRKVVGDLITKAPTDNGVALAKATIAMKDKADMFSDDPVVAATMLKSLMVSIMTGGGKDNPKLNQMVKDLAEFQSGVNDNNHTGKVVDELRKLDPKLPGLIADVTGVKFEND